jgi:hypothetical protein
MKQVTHTAPMNLSGTVWLLKKLGSSEWAAEIIKQYVNNRSDDANLFDLRMTPFADQIKDPDVIQAFNDKRRTFKDHRDSVVILCEIDKDRGWTT